MGNILSLSHLLATAPPIGDEKKSEPTVPMKQPAKPPETKTLPASASADDIKKLQAQIDKLTAQLAAQEKAAKEIKDLAEKVGKAQGGVDTIIPQLAEVVKKFPDLAKEVGGLIEAMKIRKEAIDELKQDGKDNKKALEDLQKAETKLNTALTALTKKLDDFIPKQEGINKDQAEKIIQLQKDLKALPEKITEDTKKLIEISEKKTDNATDAKVAAAVKLLNDKIATLKKDFETNLAALDKKNTDAIAAAEAKFKLELDRLNAELKVVQQQARLFDGKNSIKNTTFDIMEDMTTGLRKTGHFNIDPAGDDIKKAVAALKKSGPLDPEDYVALDKIGISKKLYDEKYQKDARGRELFADLLLKLQEHKVGKGGQVQAQDLSAFVKAGKIPATVTVTDRYERRQDPTGKINNGKPYYEPILKTIPNKTSEQWTNLIDALSQGRLAIGAK